MYSTMESYIALRSGVEKNEILLTKYDPFLSFSADILGYSATAIKLAGEGYIGESLAAIRSSIDIFITSLFSSVIWKPSSIEDFNPLGQLDSPYYHLLKEISLDDVIISKIGVGEEENGFMLKNKINEATNLCLQRFFDVFDINQEEIEPKEQNAFGNIMRKAITDISLEILKKHGNTFKELGIEITKPENFFRSLISDEQYTYKACEKCEGELIEDLKSLLQISGEMTEEIKNDLRKLTFEWDLGADKNNESDLPLCDYCGKNLAAIWSIHVRFNKDSMLKYLKWHLDTDAFNEINNCVMKVFDSRKKEFFGDLLNYKIYRELNPYAHGDPKSEPTIEEWYEKYMRPYLESLDCVYKHLVKN
ncbi:hypothetical protein [Thermoplasma acidophilum]|uniref:Uncharacterized protein n=1 Tax=Thermoplasma acidophilum (strain ATCC 25905 / DSM 1728 / JCM 9062 / NBRC 15155 / AMRC-C165) TaxID=273075 RepID=Q9HIF3_THEAC|nr:hypothetical protein [Thermoplasma acidophilum]